MSSVETQAAVTAVTDATFSQEVLNSEVPALVDFWAPWCGPCRLVAPVVADIAVQYAGRAKVVKLNVDENPSTASQYEIRSLPTLVVFKDGQPVETIVGAVSSTKLAAVMEKYAIER